MNSYIFFTTTKIKFPYNINQATIDFALKGLQLESEKNTMVSTILAESKRLSTELQQLSCVEKVYPSEANFLLVKVSEPKKIYELLMHEGIIVRDRSSVPGCEGCLRISIGTNAENSRVLELLKEY